jgi:hypothetical protein
MSASVNVERWADNPPLVVDSVCPEKYPARTDYARIEEAVEIGRRRAIP